MTVIIIGLATWRIAYMFTSELGPFHIFEKMRILAGIIHDDNGQPHIIPQKFFAEWLSCVWCFSVWPAAFWAVLYFFFPQITFWLALPFALSAAAIVLDKILS